MIQIFDWREVDRAVERIGSRLAALGYSERIGVSVRPVPCAVPH